MGAFLMNEHAKRLVFYDPQAGDAPPLLNFAFSLESPQIRYSRQICRAPSTVVKTASGGV